MSIGELAMLVNDNFDKPLNQQLRDMQYLGSYLFTSSTTFIPDKSGYYKIIVVGAGGSSGNKSGSNATTLRGGSGGVGVSTLLLEKNSQYPISVTANNSSFQYSTNKTIVATSGGNYNYSNGLNGSGGTASGGDFNYNGLDGTSVDVNKTTKGMDVGVVIPELMKSIKSANIVGLSSDPQYVQAESGDGILGYGAGQGRDYNDREILVSGKGGCVLIIPLELME